MAQAPFWWREAQNLLSDLSLNKSLKRTWKSSTARRKHSYRRWLIFFAAMVLMLLWNWQLVIATAVGIGVMLGVYLLPGLDWQVYWAKWRRFCSGYNQKLTVAVASGGFMALLTYMVSAIWVNATNRWLATGAIIQGMATFLTLGLLGWQVFNRNNYTQATEIDLLVHDLTQTDSLKRLMAVRKLTKLIRNQKLPEQTTAEIADYFRILLSQEPKATIRSAIWEALQVLDGIQPLTEIAPPLQMPVKLNSYDTIINE